MYHEKYRDNAKERDDVGGVAIMQREIALDYYFKQVGQSVLMHLSTVYGILYLFIYFFLFYRAHAPVPYAFILILFSRCHSTHKHFYFVTHLIMGIHFTQLLKPWYFLSRIIVIYF